MSSCDDDWEQFLLSDDIENDDDPQINKAKTKKG